MVLDDLLVLLIYYHKATGRTGRETWANATVSAKLLCPCDSPGKSTGVGCHALLQGIFLTQGSNLQLLVSCIVGGFFAAEPLGKGTPSSLKVIGSSCVVPSLPYLGRSTLRLVQTDFYLIPCAFP